MSKKILITGSGGFIGRNLVEYFQDTYDVLAPRSSELNLLDTVAVRTYLTEHSVDTVIHAAVYHATRNSDKDPLLGLDQNLRMFFNLAESSDIYNRMFYFGSGAEFGKQKSIISVAEKDLGLRIPDDQYGLSKFVMTRSLASYKNIYNLRLFGIFGKYEDWQIRFISNAICKAINGLDITIKKNVYFDYLYIDDFVSIVGSLLKKESLPYRDIHICSGVRVDLLTLANIIKKLSQQDINIVVSQEGLAPEYTATNTRMLEILPDVKLSSIEESIKQLYGWYSSQPELIDISKLQVDP